MPEIDGSLESLWRRHGGSAFTGNEMDPMEMVRQLGAELSNWGRWGPEDERGTINLITPKAISEAARTVRRGAVFSLALPLDLPSVAAAVIGGTSIFGGRGGYGGTIIGALILTVLTTMLTLLQMPEGARRILFGLIILAVTALYVRLTNQN